MADIFISYSRAMREATLDLSGQLWAVGYSTWTDHSLSADIRPFAQVIDAEVDAAKAVITIWSTPARNSQWVNYESTRAKKAGKLICVHTPDFNPTDLPGDFHGLHCPPVGDFASVQNALVALNAQPAGKELAPEEVLQRLAWQEWREGLDLSEDPAVLRAFIARFERARAVREVAQRHLALVEARIAARAQPAGQKALAQYELIREETNPEDFVYFLSRYAGAEPQLTALVLQRLTELDPARILWLASQEPALYGPAVPSAQRALRRRDTKAEDAILRLDPGMHTALIRRISVSADGRLLATGSHDKTVKLWALDGAGAQLIRTLRPPIGPGDQGKVYAVALDPAGRWVAAGGWMSMSGMDEFITLFDADTGRVLQRLGPLPKEVYHLAVSADGRWLAAGLGGANGVRVWERTPPSAAARPLPPQAGGDGAGAYPPPLAGEVRPQGAEGAFTLAFADTDYADRVYGLAFDGAGRLAASSWDGDVRLYDLETGQHIARVKAPGGSHPFALAFGPDRTTLAVGYADAPAVSLLDAQTLAPLPPPDLEGLAGRDLGSVAFTADGLLAAGGMHVSGGQRAVLAWPEGGRGPRATWPGADNTIMDLQPLPGGGLAVVGGEPSFALLDAAGQRLFRQGPATADLRDKKREHFTVSGDGRRLRFGLQPWSRSPVLFDLARRTLEAAADPRPDLAQADTTSLPIAGWENTFTPTLAGTALALEPREQARCLAILPDQSGFILGSEWALRRFDAAGQLVWAHAVPDVVWGVNTALEGRLVLAAYGDGTIRWHRADTGAELLALFIHLPQGPDGPREWVVFTPAGYYDCSPGADGVIGWHVNRGEDEAADFYEVKEFASAFHRPDIVDRALEGL